MIVAGLGSRKGVTEAEVLAALHAGLARYDVALADIEALAVSEDKTGEPAIHAAARSVGLVVVVIGRASLQRQSARTLTTSRASLEATGASSASEAAALAAIGERARLLGPRVATGPVTCALATDEALP
ncbi:MAG: cobalamin biosynthesis protein [Rhizobiaceae bacterium]|nr:cobalamin biosynthesis protein [Rhizobiaceae bacterium]